MRGLAEFVKRQEITYSNHGADWTSDSDVDGLGQSRCVARGARATTPRSIFLGKIGFVLPKTLTTTKVLCHLFQRMLTLLALNAWKAPVVMAPRRAKSISRTANSRRHVARLSITLERVGFPILSGRVKGNFTMRNENLTRVFGGGTSGCGSKMNRFLRHWRLTRRGEAFQDHVVFADDFVMLSRGCAQEALAWTREMMTMLGLTFNEAKSPERGLRFPWLHIRPAPRLENGHWCPGASPSKKSVQRIKTNIGDLLRSGEKGPWPRCAFD